MIGIFLRWAGLTAVVSFCGVFVLFQYCSCLDVWGHWWKRSERKGTPLFPHLKALSVSLGFQSVLSVERKMAVWNLLCRLYGIGGGKTPFISRYLAQGRRISPIFYLLAMYFLVKWKEPIDVDLLGLQSRKGYIIALCLFHFLLIWGDFEVRLFPVMCKSAVLL